MPQFAALQIGKRKLERCAALGTVLVLLVVGSAQWVRAAEPAVAFDRADLSQALLGDGTGVIVGIVDSGVSSAHPFLAGNDSLGNPRLVAQANFVPSEPSNTGGDVYGHGTAVAGILLGRATVNGVNYDGMAPDARYVNARVLDSQNGFSSTDQVVRGIQFSLSNHADIVNLSLATSAPQSDGRTQFDLLVDYVVDSLGVLVTVSGGNNGNSHAPHSPAAAQNALSVGALTADYTRVASFSNAGPASDGHMKPDLLAPGTSVSTANNLWPTGALVTNWTGTSFAAPQAAGLAAQMMDFGRAHGLATDPRVIRAVMMNSAEKTLDYDGTPWSHTQTAPLDAQQGTGRLDALETAHEYVAGQFAPGAVANVGWSQHTVTGANTPANTLETYALSQSALLGTYIDATLIWNQHVTLIDLGTPGVLDSSDIFTPRAHNVLNLFLFRDGVQVAASLSAIDTVQHIHYLVTQAGHYELRVSQPGSAVSETYALAWNSVAVPEPATWVLIVSTLLFPAASWRKRARHRHARPSR